MSNEVQIESLRKEIEDLNSKIKSLNISVDLLLFRYKKDIKIRNEIIRVLME
jgi:hypothetical protein